MASASPASRWKPPGPGKELEDSWWGFGESCTLQNHWFDAHSGSSELEMQAQRHYPVAHSLPPPSIGNRDTLELCGGFSAHPEVSVDLMVGRNL